MSLGDKLRDAQNSPRKLAWKVRPEALLCPQIPMPMSGVAPRVVMGQAWWDGVRDTAYRSTDYHCIACGVHKYRAKKFRHLEGHELYQIDYIAGRMVYVETVPLCHYCHNFIHAGRLLALVARGEVTKSEVRRILKHGNTVLIEAGLKKPIPYLGPCARWEDWRMVLDGVEYAPKYPTYEDWRREFGA